MKIIDCKWKPPVPSRNWLTIHWSQGIKSPEDIEAHLALHNLHPDVVYRDSSGTIWVEVAAQEEAKKHGRVR